MLDEWERLFTPRECVQSSGQVKVKRSAEQGIMGGGGKSVVQGG